MVVRYGAIVRRRGEQTRLGPDCVLCDKAALIGVDGDLRSTIQQSILARSVAGFREPERN